MNPVSIVTIKSKTPLFKGEEQANSIELIHLEEVGFELVAGKNMYQVGDKAIYIQPDYNLSDISLFESFIRPDGQESKSMLGKVEGKPRRIRAKKFTLHRGDNEPVYSNGILLPFAEVSQYLNKSFIDTLDLTTELGITKYEEPEVVGKGGVKVMGAKPFPSGLYKTDETNIHNVWNRIQFPIQLIGTEKIDGSSITIGIRNGEGFICSRNMLKPFTYMKTIGMRKMSVRERVYKFFGGKHPDLRIREEVSNDQDDFIKYGKPYLDAMIALGHDNIILRGELHGEHLRGSGNKNNPAKDVKPNVKFFGLDFVDPLTGIAHLQPHATLVNVLEAINRETEQTIAFIPCKEVFNKRFKSRDTLMKACESYFKKNMIEGIVIRTPDSKFSAKYMNLHYDSLK